MTKDGLLWSIGLRGSTQWEDLRKGFQWADELGFYTVSLSDHFFLRPDRVTNRNVDLTRPSKLECYTLLAAAAAVTKEVKLLPSVTPFTLRNPGQVAKMGMTIDLISGGRFILGVGTGWEEIEHISYGFPFDRSFTHRYERMIEAVEVIKKLWTEDNLVSYEGKYFQLKDAPFWPKPIQKPHPPIWFGGSGKKIRQAVAKYGDGWYPAAMHQFGITPPEYKQGWEEICEMADKAGRDPKKIMPGISFRVSIADTREEALELANWARNRVDWAPYPIEYLIERGVVVAGTPNEVAERFHKHAEAGARYISFTPIPSEDRDRQVELFMTKVMPQFK